MGAEWDTPVLGTSIRSRCGSEMGRLVLARAWDPVVTSAYRHNGDRLALAAHLLHNLNHNHSLAPVYASQSDEGLTIAQASAKPKASHAAPATQDVHSV